MINQSTINFKPGQSVLVRHIVEISEDIPFLLPNYHEQQL